MKNMHQDFNVMIDAERKSKHRLSVPTVEEVFLQSIKTVKEETIYTVETYGSYDCIVLTGTKTSSHPLCTQDWDPPPPTSLGKFSIYSS